MAVNGHAPDIRRLMREFPPRREQSDQGELVRGLNEQLALQRAEAQADRGQAEVIYES